MILLHTIRCLRARSITQSLAEHMLSEWQLCSYGANERPFRIMAKKVMRRATLQLEYQQLAQAAKLHKEISEIAGRVQLSV